MPARPFNLFALFPFICLCHPSHAVDYYIISGISASYFPSEGAFEQQQDSSASFKLLAEFRQKWGDNKNVVTFSPFYRFDQADQNRTHGDIRQFDFIHNFGDWELQAGLSRVFWGVAESVHLVDVVNQTDLVEHIDGEEKLGQPMLKGTFLHMDGSVSLFVLPYFRERLFPGSKGRLRTSWVVDDNDAIFESKDEQSHIDYAFRAQHMFGSIDIGLSYFDGTSREPSFIPNFTDLSLTPFYPQMEQFGLDLQYTGAEWLWKLEMINRKQLGDEFWAEVGGFEYTIPRLFGTRIELGLLAEYLYDSRGEVPQAPFQNDLFWGMRFVLNDSGSDSEILLGGFIDLDNQTLAHNIEYTSRLNDKMRVVAEGQLFSDVDKTDSFADFKQDSYVILELEYYF